jgi:transcription termination factor Rho
VRLRTGDHVEDAARPGRQHADGRPPRAGNADGRPPRQDKERDGRCVLDRVDSINDLTPGQSRQRPEFDELTPPAPAGSFRYLRRYAATLGADIRTPGSVSGERENRPVGSQLAK